MNKHQTKTHWQLPSNLMQPWSLLLQQLWSLQLWTKPLFSLYSNVQMLHLDFYSNQNRRSYSPWHSQRQNLKILNSSQLKKYFFFKYINLKYSDLVPLISFHRHHHHRIVYPFLYQKNLAYSLFLDCPSLSLK